MRTLDIGGDKSLSYFPIEEENPFLGWRGIRVTFGSPGNIFSANSSDAQGEREFWQFADYVADGH